jgi:ribosomal protein S1
VQEGKTVEVQVVSIDKETKRIGLSMKAIQEQKRKEENDAAKAELATREATAEAEDESADVKPKKTYRFQLKGGK